MILFSLQKTLALLVMPIGLLWLLMLGAAFLFWRRRQRGPAVAFLALAGLYSCAGSVHLGTRLMAGLEAGIPALDLAAVEPFDAVCVLGSGSDLDPAGNVQLSSAGDRVYIAAKLWHAGKAKVLVASGSARDSRVGVRDGGEETRILWHDMGVADSAIVVVAEPCWVTRDEIAAYRRLQQQHGWKRMALVSSASHLPRALGLARRAGLSVTPVGADWQSRPLPLQMQSLIPQIAGFHLVSKACWERLGRRVGR